MHLSLYRDHRRKNISLKQVSIQVSMLGDCFYNHWVVSRQCVKHSLELLCFPPAALQLYWRYWGSEEKRYRKLCLFCSASNSELNPAGSKEFAASCVKATQTAIQGPSIAAVTVWLVSISPCEPVCVFVCYDAIIFLETPAVGTSWKDFFLYLGWVFTCIFTVNRPFSM